MAELRRVTDQSSDVLLISHIRGWRTGGGGKVSMRRVREEGREREEKEGGGHCPIALICFIRNLRERGKRWRHLFSPNPSTPNLGLQSSFSTQDRWSRRVAWVCSTL